MIWNSDGTQSDVQRIHDTLAVGGFVDTITLPNNTYPWTSGVILSKSITILGGTTTDSVAGTANDQTILVDSLADGQAFFKSSVSVRITGLTFTGVGGTRGTVIYGGLIRFNGGDQNRIDHCHLTGYVQQNNFIAVYGPTYGVADHLVLDQLGNQLCESRAYNGTGTGDLEFSQPAGWGSNKFFFMEDCYINNTAGPYTASGGWDAYQGGKLVVRHCRLFDVEILCHGTEDGRMRGGRAMELYNNEYHWSYTTTMDGIRSGSMLAHDNTFVGHCPNGYGLQTYRTFYGYTSGTWKGASGDNAWDYNATEADGTHVDGHPPYLFESGTLTGAVAPNTLIDSTKTWTAHHWIGYEYKRTSDGATAYIVDNDATTLTVKQWVNEGFGAGQDYQIHKVLVAIDQPGSGNGDLVADVNTTSTDSNTIGTGAKTFTVSPGLTLTAGAVIDILYHFDHNQNMHGTVSSYSGTTLVISVTSINGSGTYASWDIVATVNTTTGTQSWLNQVREPCYSWGSVFTPTGAPVNDFDILTNAPLVPGVDYNNNTAKPGYTPHCYPHPLVSGIPCGGDITPPVITLDSPSGTVSGVITLSATATDDVAMAGVQFRRDGVNNIGSEVMGAGPTYTRTFDTQTVPNGNHTFTALARDTATPGNTTVSNVLTLNVQNADTTPPTVSITAPSNGAIVSGAAVAIIATASDNVAVLGVVFKCDGVTVGSEDTSSPYSVSLDTTGLTDGVHFITATARDTGLTATSTINVTVANGSVTPPVGHLPKKGKKKALIRRRG